MPAHRKQLVSTITDRCRVCYTCVRECPVKAIKIVNGQAQVINERCIGCGNCVKVCSQGAKVFLDGKPTVQQLLASDAPVVALVAPSFVAEFTDLESHRQLVGMLRQLGFDYVTEVAFGADMIAREYSKVLMDEIAPPSISSDCPAIVYYIEHYYPELTASLAPLASPMVAMSRIVKQKYGKQVKTVFIGPCVAKKAESPEVDEVLTFIELRDLFKLQQIHPQGATASEFDPPLAGKGAIFPITRGLLQTTNMSEDICEGNIVVAEGKINFKDAVKEFENGLIHSHHLELLCCEGCIMGPGMSPSGKRYERRILVSRYVNEKLKNLDTRVWKNAIKEFSNIDLSATFSPADRRLERPSAAEIEKVLESMGKTAPSDHLNCGACGYHTCEEHAIAIAQGLAESEMCLPQTIESLHNYINELNISNEKLANAQQALQQQEKLASMGQLSAGIAHELNNPLGVITMYSNILKDEVGETSELFNDLDLIVEQTNRCKKIVGGLLNFARKNQVNLIETNLAELIKRSLHSIIKTDRIQVHFKNTVKHPMLPLDADQMLQVLTNLEKNSVEAMPQGGILNIRLQGNEKELIIEIEDNGTGISRENMDKIFTPFFTTKGVGKGTGLGLPLIYGIVKMHRGKINVVSNADASKGPTGTTFRITLARTANIDQNNNSNDI